jgi:hypothetical protein
VFKGHHCDVRLDKDLRNVFPVRLALKQGNDVSLLHFNFCTAYAIKKAHGNKENFEMNKTHQLLLFADDINLLSENANIIKIR